ncbi:MAG: M24 family metallopeptidase [Candidatus Aenigmatarchaeota archaeon]
MEKKKKKIIKTLIEAYELAKIETKIGASCFSVFDKVDLFLRKNGYRMLHSLGHGIGKKVHELPIIGIPKEKLKKFKNIEKIENLKKIKFENGMVFILDPGIYIKNVGGCRIENTFLFWNNKLVQLTKARLLKFY